MDPSESSFDFSAPSVPDEIRAAVGRIAPDRLAELLTDPAVLVHLEMSCNPNPSAARLAARGRLAGLGLWYAESEDKPPPPPDNTPVTLYGRDGKRLPTKDRPPARRVAVSVKLSEVVHERVRWLWPGRIPLRRVTVIAGRQGQGKSTLVSWLASTVSQGRFWPDVNDPNPAGSVVILQAEEIISEDVKPRIEAMGGDPEKIHFLKATKLEGEVEGVEIPFNLFRDVECLAELITRVGNVRLVVVDPLSSYVKGINGYNDSEVRSYMQPFYDLAEKHQFAIVLIVHPSKDNEKDILDRIGNSAAFTQMARMIWSYSRDPKRKSRRMLSLIKGNTRGCIRTAISVGMKGDCLNWAKEAVKMDAWDVDALLQKLDRDRRLMGRSGPEPVGTKRASEFFLGTAENWPMWQTAVADLAQNQGIKEGTFRVAFSKLEEQGKLKRVWDGTRMWFHRPDAPAGEQTPPSEGTAEGSAEPPPEPT